MSVSRREFLGTLAASAAVGAEVEKKALPTRVLGRTGEKVSILAFGCGSRFLMYKEEEKAIEALTRGLDSGITYVDTAYGYGNGVSEERVGKALKGRRKGLFLATKVPERKADDAMKIIEGSLKRLQTEQVDLIHIHSLTDEADLAAVEAKDGVMALLHKLRDQKVTRFIGVTSHTNPTVLKTALERHDFDCVQMSLNAALAGMTNGQRGMIINEELHQSFEKLALPVAKRKKMGVIAMKIYAQEGLVGQAPPEKLLGYALSLPVTTAVVGMPKLEQIDENVQIARVFKPLAGDEMQRLSGELSQRNKTALDWRFARHVDA